MPGVTAVTTPVPLTVAVALLLLQVPPGDGSVNRLKVPLHIVDGPVTGPAEGTGLTVTGAVVVAVPQLPLTV